MVFPFAVAFQIIEYILEFDFEDFGLDARVQGMIGLPRGLNVGQWLGNMKAEHCDVDPGNCESALWGASARALMV